MAESIRKRRESMERRLIRVSEKRQITIPRKYFEALGFGSEAECLLRDGEIVLRPARSANGEFAEQILAALVAEGLSGEALLSAFKREQAKVRLMDEVSKGRMSGEEKGWISAEEVREHFHAKAKM